VDGAVGGSPLAAEWQATKDAVAAEPGCAALGALLDHLLERAQSGIEQDILADGATLHEQAQDLLATLRPLRSQFEAMIADPGTATVEKLADVTAQLQDLQTKLRDAKAQLDLYQSRVLSPFRHATPEGIARDEATSAWSWRDVVLSRRTDAFVRALEAAGDGSAATKAFAFGALTGYAANVVGSSFIAQTVGGPRRSHPLRDRIARYAVGAWVKVNEPLLTPSLSKLRASLLLGDPATPALPAAIRGQVEAAIASTFPADAPAVLPDLDQAYSSLLRHLELLEAFPDLAPVKDIVGPLLVRVLKDPEAASIAQLKPSDWRGPFNDPSDPTVSPVPPPPDGSATKTTDGGCAALGILLLCITILGLIIYHLIAGRWPWQPAGQGESPSSSAQALGTFVPSHDALVIVALFYRLELGLFEGVSTAVGYLKYVGLLYPDEQHLTESHFQQFTALSVAGPVADHPHRSMPDPDREYAQFPSSPIEEPAAHPSVFPAGSTPDAFLRGQPDQRAGIGALGRELWLRHRDAPRADDVNLNLDADRGAGAACWRVARETSITTNPVHVEVLAYGDVQ
jgi:hypothetical protein